MRSGFVRVAACFLVLGGCVTAASALAQAPLDKIKACSQIADDAERLACYDAAAAELGGESGAPPGAAAKRRSADGERNAPGPAGRAGKPESGKSRGKDVPEKRRGAERESARAEPADQAEPGEQAEPSRSARASGETETKQADEDRFGLPPERDEEDEDADTRRMTIAETQETPRLGRLVLTMENGQVWRQTGERTSLPPIEPGMEVKIEEGLFGGFRLSVSGRTIRVERVR